MAVVGKQPRITVRGVLSPVSAQMQAPEVAGLARAEQLLTQAQKAVAARQADLRAADEQLQVCEKRLREGKHAKSQNKSSPAKSAEAQGKLQRMFDLQCHRSVCSAWMILWVLQDITRSRRRRLFERQQKPQTLL